MHDDSKHRAAGAPGRYTLGAIVLHWLVAALLLGQIAFGWFLRTVPRGIPARGLYVNLHKSIGLTLAAIILVRILWRLTHAVPQPPSFMSAWERAAARWNHAALYVLMVVMPTSGYVASNFSKYGVKLFDTFTLRPWGGEDHRIYAIFNTTHVYSSYLFVGLIAVHVLAAIGHAVRRDTVFSRMWPARSAGRAGP